MMQTVNFKLTDAQYRKLIKAREKGESVILRLNKSQKNPGGTSLLLSELEIKKLNDGNSHDIMFSRTRMGGIVANFADFSRFSSSDWNINWNCNYSEKF